jgi:hypothetical protein
MAWGFGNKQDRGAAMSSSDQMRQRVKEEVAGFTRKMKFEAMLRSGGSSYENIVRSLRQVGIRVPFGRRITPLEASRAAQQGFLKKRAY